jgi:CPA2 family monovalent cation:H+ antiporter-2
MFGVAGMIFGIPASAAFLLGAILSLSSTAVVGRLIAERHQRGCPVGLTATSILVFQDIAAIFLLVIAGAAADEGSLWVASFWAVLKAVVAFAVTVLIARLVVGRILGLVARSRNDEVFTAVTLFFALAAGWASGSIGLSLTLGAFLGGQALSDTPYRSVIEYEIKPFLGLLLGFFFISIGLSLDPAVLLRSWMVIAGLTALMIALKIVGNVLAGLIFRWSVPGSTQLGFLLAQGSEFAFIILAIPAVQEMIGRERVSIVIAVVALSIALTPNLAETGRQLAGRMRRRNERTIDKELVPSTITAPVIIVGMGSVGRLVADAVIAFGINYLAVEMDESRLRTATADGYHVSFGNGTDARLWSAVSLGERKISVLTAPSYEQIKSTRGAVRTAYPKLKRFAYAINEADAERLRSLDLIATPDTSGLPGVALATAVLSELGVGDHDVKSWLRQRLELTSIDAETVAWGGLG